VGPAEGVAGPRSFAGLGLSDAISVVARARNHLQANTSLGFCFEIRI